MSGKTYVLKANSGRKDAYSPFVFSKRPRRVDDDHLVFSTAVELADRYHLHDLEGVAKTISLMEGKTLDPSRMEPTEIAKYIFVWTKTRARGSTVTEFTELDETEVTTEIDEAPVKAKGKAKKAKAPKEPKEPKEPKKEATHFSKNPVAQEKIKNRKLAWPDEAGIVQTGVEIPLRPGSNRYRNVETVTMCSTIKEAKERLRKLDPPGSPHDIIIAEAHGVIEILLPENMPKAE